MPVVLIPAFQPSTGLLGLVEELRSFGLPVVIVNDGSSPDYHPLFAQAASLDGVEVLAHARNLGKGAALRTGFNHILCKYSGHIVTADADGQHAPADILRVAQALDSTPDRLILGVRQMTRKAPFRSRLGNGITTALFRLLHGEPLSDTQTGLRGVPRTLAEAMLSTPAFGYEFELDMLITSRQMGFRFREVPIETLYFDGNQGSHFNPLLDSMRIYFVLLRFAMASLFTACCDNFIFFLVHASTGNPLGAQVAARLASVLLSFTLNKQHVFRSHERNSAAMARFLIVVVCSGAISYLSLMSIHTAFGVPIYLAKILAESVIFFANFALLRDFVFAAPANGATDWSRYYQQVPYAAGFTRKYTERSLLQAMKVARISENALIYEFGGANSCFLNAVHDIAQPRAYHVIDTNTLGLDLLEGRNAIVHHADVLDIKLNPEADLVFSVGLVEHFDRDRTARAVLAHFDQVRPGGWVLISFPCPTVLYRATRTVLEAAGHWAFPDERALLPSEVLAIATQRGDLVWQKTLWPTVLTQHMMLFRAR